MGTVEVCVPVAETDTVRLPFAPRPAELAGLTLGWLDNQKANARALLDALRASLAARGIESNVVTLSKNATAAAPTAVMAQLRRCHAVVLAIAD